MEHLLFDSWDKLGRMVISAVVMYLLIVVSVKLSGKRSTSQMNNFDWVVTVTLGSLSASIILLKSVPLVEGSSAIITLLLLQYLVTKYSSISPAFAELMISDPSVVFYKGQFLPEPMKKERLTRSELICAMRSEGVHDFADVEAIVFESDAKLTVITKNKSADDTMAQTIKDIVKTSSQ